MDKGADLVSSIAEEGADLKDIIAEIEEAFAADDYCETCRLLESELLAAWYGFHPSTLVRILSELEANYQEMPPALRAFSVFLSSGAKLSIEDESLLKQVGYEDSPKNRAFLAAFRMFDFRLNGHPKKALRILPAVSGFNASLQPLFDSFGGWALFSMVQRGITAMLAGSFNEALTSLISAQMHVQVPALGFLSRDALVKQALIYSVFGDMRRVEYMLEQAEEVPRTISWAERGIDTNIVIARALAVKDSDLDDAIDSLERLPLHEVGEIWPFYVYALHSALIRAGRTSDAEVALTRLSGVPLPRVNGEGFSGSVFPVLMAAHAIADSRWEAAQEALDEADPEFILTSLMQAYFYVLVGRAGQALQVVSEVSEETRLLPQMERRRLGIMAGAYLAMEEHEACLSTLRKTMQHPKGTIANESFYYTREVREFALKNIPDWGLRTGFDSSGEATIAIDTVRLTRREREILGELAKGRRQKEVAESLYISLNTLKAHTKSIYRKLGVAGQKEAVIAAQQRGLV